MCRNLSVSDVFLFFWKFNEDDGLLGVIYRYVSTGVDWVLNIDTKTVGDTGSYHKVFVFSRVTTYAVS